MFTVLNESDDESSISSKIHTIVQIISSSPEEQSYLITSLSKYFEITRDFTPVSDPTQPKDWHSGSFLVVFLFSRDTCIGYNPQSK